MNTRNILILALMTCSWGSSRALAVVISEIHYAPPAGEETLEFVELTNDSLTPEDISGYAFTEGISFEVPPGTVLAGRGVLVICANVAAVKARYGIANAVGDFIGRLDNAGERLTLVNHAGIELQSVRYRVRGKWSVAPAGTGHTLTLRSVLADPQEPESWTQSLELGGTPGRLNFGDSSPVVTEDRVLIDRGATWRYARGNAAFSTPVAAWIQPAFNDAAWLTGPSGFGYGDADDATELLDMQDSYANIACRKHFTLTAADLASGQLYLAVDFDDGFCAYVNGVEVARVNCSPGAAAPAAGETASASREAGTEDVFPLPRAALVQGDNVLAIAGSNFSVNSTDFSLIPRLLHRGAVGGGPATEEVIIAAGESWRYLKGTGPFSSPVSAWRASDFNDGSWSVGGSGFGYRVVGDATTSYVVPAGTVGNQEYGGSLGMDFDVLEEIVVTRLGVFDSNADGINTALTARLYDRASLQELARLEFSSGSPGELVEGSRFKDLPGAITLPVGFQGTIVAEGYGPGEPNGNQGTSPLGLTTDDGSGAIQFVGAGRFGASGAFPDSVDGGPVNRYAAGTFDFRSSGAMGGEIVAPAGALTLLADMRNAYTSIATRKRFTVTREQLDNPGEFLLAVSHDDGFCAYVNGVEVARRNCGAAGSEPVWNGLATAVASGQGEQVFPLPANVLVEGDNVLAMAGFNAAIDSTAFLLNARLFRRQLVLPTAGAGMVFNELQRGTAVGQGWVELFNKSSVSIALGGHRLTDDPARPDAYLLPAGTSLAPREFLVLTAAETGLVLSIAAPRLFLLAPDGRVVTAATFDQAPAPDAVPGSWSECRIPDGGELEWISRTPTPGAPNQVATLPTVVINEIFYHPPENRAGEFVELYNHGVTAVDLSGFRFTDGIGYTFADGVTLGPGQFLVLAEDPTILRDVYGVAALGPWSGQLADGGESIRLADRDGNPVDEVRYFDGGRWSEWADGGGSSLELIDPTQENGFAAAWEGSDESEKAPWQEHTFRVDNYVVAAESELHLYLVERGECLVDDVDIRRGGGANLIPNGGFEGALTAWRIGGTHIRSVRTTEDRRSGSAALKVVASSRGDTLVNRIEVDTSPAMTAGPYDVTVWTRWLRGASVLIAHGEYSRGPYRVTPCFTCGTAEPNLSGNPLAMALRLSIPLNLGTPGAENTARQGHRAATGTFNLGPVTTDVLHSPAVPEPGFTVQVSARIADSDGVAAAFVRYRVGSAQGAFDAVPCVDDGLHGDGDAGDGVFGAQLPGFTAGSRVVYYIDAVDARGATRAFPVEAPARTCLFLVLSRAAASKLDNFHIVLDQQRSSELQSRQLHSNDLVDCTFVFGDEKVHYNVGTRYRGSPWGRPSLQSYSVRFNEDAPFLRRLGGINVSKTGAGIGEGAAMFLIGRNSQPARPSPAPDYLYGRGWVNGAGVGIKGLIEPLDGDFLEKWHGDGAVGPLLKAFGRFVFNDGGGLTGQSGWEGASFVYRGEDSENYRGYFVHSASKSEDNWSPVYPLFRLLDAVETPNAEFDADVAGIVDLDAFLRVFGARMLVTDCDGFGINNGHNGHLAFNSLTGLWGYLPFDVECSFVSTGPNLLQTADPGTTRILTRPPSRRAYFRILAEYLQGYWSARSSPLLDALQAATGHGTGGIKGHISAVANVVRQTIQSSQNVTFRIVTNNGQDLSVTTADVELEGDATVAVDALFVSRNGDEPTSFLPLWTTPTRWKARFLLPGDRTVFEVFGFDVNGNILGSDAIAVTTSLQPELALTGLSPDRGPSGGGTRVTLRGVGFAAGMQVLMGGEVAASLVVVSPTELMVTTPPAPQPFPLDGSVDVVVTRAAARASLPRAFTYEAAGRFLRGDANGDGKQDLSDAVRILAYLFLGTVEPLRCEQAADVDDSGVISISDPIQLLNYLFLAGQKPADPFDACGVDTTPDALGCEAPPEC